MSLFHLPPSILAAASRAAETSEPDALQRWPILTTLLLATGLIADAFIVSHWKRRRREAVGDALRVGPKPWGMTELLTAAGIALSVFLTVTIAAGLLRLKIPAMLATIATAELVLLGVMFICLRVAGQDWRNVFGLHPGSTRHAVMMGVVFFLAVLPPLQVLSIFRDAVFRFFEWKISSQDLVQLLLKDKSPVLTGILFIFAIAVAPLCEEAFFRGLAYPALKQRWGVLVALGITSALFACIHLHLPSFPLLFALAAGLALSYEYTGSLLTPIVMHSIFNLFNTAVLIASRSTP